MEAIEIARKLASLGSAAEAQDAYGLVIHQSGNPAEKLEAAVYILHSGGNYKVSYTCFRDLYNQGHFQEQILPLMAGAFYEPNVKELESRYQQNCRLLKKYPYLFRKDFLPFEQLPILFFPYDENGYVPFFPDRRRFGDYINFKNPVVSRNFFRDLEKPILADDVYSQYELEYLNDNVRRSEYIGRENHVYLHYADWGIFCAHLQCLDLHRLLKDEKLIFLIGGDIQRYPIDFKAEYGIDYSRCPLKPVGVREINRLIWHTQLSAHNGGDFFNEVFDAHPNMLVLSSIMIEELTGSIDAMKEKMDRAKSLREALELFPDWPAARVEELYRINGRQEKDFAAAVFLENPISSAGQDWSSRIAPAVFLQPHFPRIVYNLYVERGSGRTVLESEDYETVQNMPLFRQFKYIKTFTPMRRFTTSYCGSMRFIYYNVKTGGTISRDTNCQNVVSDMISEYIANRSFMADPEDRLYQDSILVRFEDAKLNPLATFTALAAFLDVPYAESMTRCTEGGKDFCTPGNVKGFDTASVYRTYDEFANNSERCFIEYFLRDAYAYYGYDFHYYDGTPMDDDRVQALIDDFTTLDHYIRWSWEKAFDSLRTGENGERTISEEEEEGLEKILEDVMRSTRESRIKNAKILMRDLRFVNKNGRALQMMKKLEPDPALLEQPLYH